MRAAMAGATTSSSGVASGSSRGASNHSSSHGVSIWSWGCSSRGGWSLDATQQGWEQQRRQRLEQPGAAGPAAAGSDAAGAARRHDGWSLELQPAACSRASQLRACGHHAGTWRPPVLQYAVCIAHPLTRPPLPPPAFLPQARRWTWCSPRPCGGRCLSRCCCWASSGSATWTSASASRAAARCPRSTPSARPSPRASSPSTRSVRGARGGGGAGRATAGGGSARGADAAARGGPPPTEAAQRACGAPPAGCSIAALLRTALMLPAPAPAPPPPSAPSPPADVDEQSKNEIKDILLTYDRTLLVADPRRCEPKKASALRCLLAAAGLRACGPAGRLLAAAGCCWPAGRSMPCALLLRAMLAGLALAACQRDLLSVLLIRAVRRPRRARPLPGAMLVPWVSSRECVLCHGRASGSAGGLFLALLLRPPLFDCPNLSTLAEVVPLIGSQPVDPGSSRWRLLRRPAAGRPVEPGRHARGSSGGASAGRACCVASSMPFAALQQPLL